MFDTRSRYYSIDTATYVTPDGRSMPYKRRRFLPQGSSLPLLVEVAVNQGDRLDLLTARTMGDPEQFWRVCDANDAMNPWDLVSELGRVLRVPVPQA
jgi:hypothetical protein